SAVIRAARLRANLELGSGEAAVREDLAYLFDALIRPVLRASDDERALIVAPDRSLLGVPYAALYDTVSRSYLVEKRPVSLAVASGSEQPVNSASWSPVEDPLFVADPAFDPDLFHSLQRLPNAATEVETVAQMYEGSIVLQGSAAT